MKIKFIGKQHMKGTSKRTGNDYDFITLYFVGKDRRVVGECGQQINVDPSMIDFNTFDLSRTYDVEFGLGNAILSIEPVK